MMAAKRPINRMKTAPPGVRTARRSRWERLARFCRRTALRPEVSAVLMAPPPVEAGRRPSPRNPSS